MPNVRTDRVTCQRRLLELLHAAHLVWPMLAVPGLLVLVGALILFHSSQRGLAAVVLVFAAVALAIIAQRTMTQLLCPLIQLEEALTRICEGEPGASESLQQAGVLTAMAQDISSLNAELTDLYEDMDARVARQTIRLAQKTASLKILYDVAAGIAQTEHLDEMLLRFLRVLKEMVNGRAAMVRLIQPSGHQRLVGVLGLDPEQMTTEGFSPVELCLCATVLCPDKEQCQYSQNHCSRLYGCALFASEAIDVVTVPLSHHDELLGVYTLFINRPGVAVREDILQLLATIGQHIGVAIAKYRSDEEARRLSTIEERNSLAHELHDSLAQTLASLRLQVRMLEDTLKGLAHHDQSSADLKRIRHGIDEAHSELRELLASFRAPLDRRGLVPALKHLAKRFEQQTQIHTVVHICCTELELSAAEDLHVLRIAQEALNNVRKHAQAQTVRILLRRESDNQIKLLIEDDGVGFAEPVRSSHPGEHIGLAILEERARRIGATLVIESDPGDGTRVELRFAAIRHRVAEQRTVVH